MLWLSYIMPAWCIGFGTYNVHNAFMATDWFSFSLLFSQLMFAQAPIIEWQKTIGGSEAEALYSLQQTADGGYILGGQSMSGVNGDKTEANFGGWDYWVVKLDANGNIVWQNTIGGSNDDYIRSIQQTTDRGYILGGRSIL